MSEEKIFTVTEITRDLKKVIRNSFGTFWIEGELSGYKHHTSGHHYFTLKDSGAQISGAMWKMSGDKLNFRPQDGMKVQVWGNLDLYEPQGKYQLIAIAMRQAGVGELQAAFEKLKQKLQTEGLFDEEQKKELPAFPLSIGIVTSETGAALQDMLNVARRRWPSIELWLYPSLVQGAGAAEQIAEGIAAFNRSKNVDVIVVGRGGGSLEDLWPFNEEIVARAIFKSELPIVSAVGHEVDFTIADFVADLRAPTPSAAMELVLPDREEVLRQINQLKRRLSGKVLGDIKLFRRHLSSLSQHWALREPINILRNSAQRLDELQTRLEINLKQLVDEKKSALDRVRELLTLFRPQAILARGYAIVQDSRGTIVRDSNTLAVGDHLQLTLAKGSAETEVKSLKPTS